MKIYCDESGFTGDDLLETNQPYFVYSAVSLTDEILDEIVNYVYNNYNIQNGEIKGKNLVNNKNGQNVVKYIFENYSQYARLVYHDKKYALAGKIVEYAVEPYLKSNFQFYQSKLHIYLASGFYLAFHINDYSAEALFEDFLALVRKKKTYEETIFYSSEKENDFLKWLFDIVSHSPEIMLNEIQHQDENPQTKWILDLTLTSLFGLLTEWSKNGEELEVICDDSKVFKNSSIIKSYNSMGLKNSRAEFLGTTIGFNLKRDIVNSDSKSTIGLQIADLFSSTIFYCLKNMDSDFSKYIMAIVYKKCLCSPETFCIMPTIIEDVKEYDNEKLLFYRRFMAFIYNDVMNS